MRRFAPTSTGPQFFPDRWPGPCGTDPADPKPSGGSSTTRPPSRHRRQRAVGPLSAKRRALAVLGAFGVLAGGYAFSGSHQQQPPQMAMMPAPMVPDFTGDDEWAAHAQVALASVNQQLDALDQAEVQFQWTPAGHDDVDPPPAVAELQDRRVLLEQQQATLQSQLDTYDTLSKAQKDQADTEASLRSVEQALSDAPSQPGSREQAAAIAALNEQRDLRQRQLEAGREELRTLQDTVRSAIRTPLPDDPQVTDDVRNQVLQVVKDEGGARPGGQGGVAKAGDRSSKNARDDNRTGSGPQKISRNGDTPGRDLGERDNAGTRTAPPGGNMTAGRKDRPAAVPGGTVETGDAGGRGNQRPDDRAPIDNRPATTRHDDQPDPRNRDKDPDPGRSRNGAGPKRNASTMQSENDTMVRPTTPKTAGPKTAAPKMASQPGGRHASNSDSGPQRAGSGQGGRHRAAEPDRQATPDQGASRPDDQRPADRDRQAPPQPTAGAGQVSNENRRSTPPRPDAANGTSGQQRSAPIRESATGGTPGRSAPVAPADQVREGAARSSEQSAQDAPTARLAPAPSHHDAGASAPAHVQQAPHPGGGASSKSA